MLFQRRAIFIGAFLAATIAAGCGGGSGPSPLAAPAASPGSSISSLVAVPGTAGTLSLPAVAGITPAFGLNSGAPVGLTMTATVSTVAPAGALPASNARRPAAATSPTPAPTAVPIPFLFMSVTFSANVPAGVVASEILTYGSNGTPNGALTSVNGVVTCQIDDLSANPATVIGTIQGVVSGATATFINGTSGGPALIAGHNYLFQFYIQPASGPTPTPSPSPTATGSSAPTPSPTATASGTATAPPQFTLSGASATTASVTPPTAPAPLVVPASGPGYGTYSATATFQFGAATTTAAYTMTASLGSTSADISPAAQFPFYTGSAATPLFYAQLTPSVAVAYSQTPAINVTVSSFGSHNSCSLYIYTNTGGATYVWVQVPGTTVNVSGTTVAIPAAAPIGSAVNLLPNQANLAFVGC